MKFRNNNKAIINKLTKRSIKANKMRNIFAIIGIALTTILFTTLFTIGSGIKNSTEQQNMRQAGGYAHGTFKDLTNEEFNKIKNHPLIKKSGYSIMVSMGENKEFLKNHVEIRYANDEEAKMCFSFPTEGKMPEKENEVVTDTTVLDLLGVKHEIGQNIKLDYKIGDKKYSKTFILSGFWQSDEVMPGSMIYVSKEFIDKNVTNVDLKDCNNESDTGFIYLDVMFRNSRNIEQNMIKILHDCGYSNDSKSPNFIGIGVNWSYLSTSFEKDNSIIFAILGVSILIIFTGYLIIYNIFQISIMKDIRFYGLLKTIGMTPKQIKKLVKKQAFLLSIIGIAIGLILGYGIGNVLLPIVISTSTIKSSYKSVNPIIFIGSTIFSLITVFISCRKPSKIASKVSPIEATKYVDVILKLKKEKKSSNGGKIYKMAFSNILRNKKKTAIVLISMSLSLILLNSVVTFIDGFSMDKYLERSIKTDFIGGSANYFNIIKCFTTEDDVVSEKMIGSIENLDGIKNSGRIYYNLKPCESMINGKKSEVQLYGMEELPLSKLSVFEGMLDLEKLKSGKYIIEGVSTDDNGNVRHEMSKCKIGDKITIELEDNIKKEYEVLAKAKVDYCNSARYSLKADCIMYLPSDEFKKLIEKPLTMSYLFDVKDGYMEGTEKFLKDYTTSIEPEMNYDSKIKYSNEFKNMQNMILLVGSVLSVIIGTIGILNFINAILTSIITRRREFAMIQSIGMTNKQLNKMLILEGFFYAIQTVIISIVLGSLVSIFIVRPIGSSLWFFNYKFKLSPILIVSPFLILIAIFVPFISSININKQTIVERLREAE